MSEFAFHSSSDILRAEQLSAVHSHIEEHLLNETMSVVAHYGEVFRPIDAIVPIAFDVDSFNNFDRELFFSQMDVVARVYKERAQTGSGKSFRVEQDVKFDAKCDVLLLEMLATKSRMLIAGPRIARKGKNKTHFESNPEYNLLLARFSGLEKELERMNVDEAQAAHKALGSTDTVKALPKERNPKLDDLSWYDYYKNEKDSFLGDVRKSVMAGPRDNEAIRALALLDDPTSAIHRVADVTATSLMRKKAVSGIKELKEPYDVDDFIKSFSDMRDATRYSLAQIGNKKMVGGIQVENGKSLVAPVEFLDEEMLVGESDDPIVGQKAKAARVARIEALYGVDGYDPQRYENLELLKFHLNGRLAVIDIDQLDPKSEDKRYIGVVYKEKAPDGTIVESVVADSLQLRHNAIYFFSGAYGLQEFGDPNYWRQCMTGRKGRRAARLSGAIRFKHADTSEASLMKMIDICTTDTDRVVSASRRAAAGERKRIADLRRKAAGRAATA